ncbi:MAG TPA: formylglycine-generating enzyme family protein [Gemmata sp.]|jgi:formylglycine-generating enzyme required for sulfatase activity|nr:formylglycine-generating enzyme family protein [Gemmata sp.]
MFRLLILLVLSALTCPITALSTEQKTSQANEARPGEVRIFEIAKGVFMEFCWIPAGEAQLGSPKEEQSYLTRTVFGGERPDRLDDEAEAKRGKFKTMGFWLGKYPVTQEEWKAVMGNNPSFFQLDGGGNKALQKDKIIVTSRFPVEEVTWNDCQKFLEKVNKRAGAEMIFAKAGKFVLPHENEWEYACRGGKGNQQAFYFGNELNGAQANCDGKNPYGTDKKGDNKGRTTEVGSYAKGWPHPWGLCDMHGNVLQWCENKYDQLEKRVLRGGSWGYHSAFCRSAIRFRRDSADTDGLLDVGLRVCFRLD